VHRREYDIEIIFNGIAIKKVIIDPHFELKHLKSINDEIILRLVQMLDGEVIDPQDESPSFTYFAREMILDGKAYRLIWLLEDNQIYIGVVNAYRR
jgi:hypothetical protein